MKTTIRSSSFTHDGNRFFLCLIDANTLTEITYVARRGVDEEQGAVQRILNRTRIAGIRDFLINDGFFPNNVILNLKEEAGLEFDLEQHIVSFEIQPRVAQIIDGQHRVEGLREAIKIDEKIGRLQIPTVLCNNLSTADCAEIFISINTEQKPVAKSLIYDLYGLMNISAQDFSVERGTDIARALNSDDTSPYQGCIKFPGSRKFKGGIQLSTVVNSFKPLVKNSGEFSKYNLNSLENQTNVIKNYFNAIQYYYGDSWEKLSNPFKYASGFSAAIEVLISKILPICFASKDFTESHIRTIFSMPKERLIQQSEVKGMSGEASKALILGRLLDCINSSRIAEEEFKI